MNPARKSYDAQFKLIVIEQAEKTSNRAAERALGVSECMIRKWRSQKEDMKKAGKSSKKLPGGGRKAQYNDIEDQIMERIMREQVFGKMAFGEKRLLVWDSFRPHIKDRIKEMVRKRNAVMAVIPGSCTKILQPLDVSINKPFKGFFREMYDEWFRAGKFEYTRGGNIKPPSLYQQISEAFKKFLKRL